MPPDSVLAPFTIWRGFPSKKSDYFNFVDTDDTPLGYEEDYSTNIDSAILNSNTTELPECWMELQQEITTTFYRTFIPQ